jgi:2-isopropylmalate synthase
VFAAFSGSHQDAIAKGMKFRQDKNIPWTVPYLPLDPKDVGRVYEADVIRINSQSGKGGIGYILETQFNLNLPPKMREVFGYHIKSISDHEHRELQPKEVYDIFLRDFVNVNPYFSVNKAIYTDTSDGRIEGEITITNGEKLITVESVGNGRLDCVSNAIKAELRIEYSLETYAQHALEGKTTSSAASYVSIAADGKIYWGTGIDSDISTSSVKALVSAVNLMLAKDRKE